MRTMRKEGGTSLLNPCRCGHSDGLKLRGQLELFVEKKGLLVDRFVYKNIILNQGLAQVISTLATVSGTTINGVSQSATLPQIIHRMAIGDQGALGTSLQTPKVPVATQTALFHEVYRQDVSSSIVTANSDSTVNLTCTLIFANPLVTTTSTTSIAAGMAVSGTGIPTGSVVAAVTSSTTFTIGPLPPTETVSSPGETLTFTGAASQGLFTTTFVASSVSTSAFTTPSAPVVNEVGLVLINPGAASGITRTAVTPPTTPPSDETLMSIRCFPSVPFLAGNDVSITVRYMIYLQ